MEVTDPGKAMLSSKGTDIGTKGPMLRGPAGRAPYLNGSATDLTTMVNFYDARFNIGFTPQQVSDLVEFRNSL